MIGADSRFRIAPRVHAREFAGELVILDIARGRYYSLDDVGTRMWRGLELGETPRAIVERIATEYAAEPERVLADLLGLVDDLLSQGLILDVGRAVGSSDADP